MAQARHRLTTERFLAQWLLVLGSRNQQMAMRLNRGSKNGRVCIGLNQAFNRGTLKIY